MPLSESTITECVTEVLEASASGSDMEIVQGAMVAIALNSPDHQVGDFSVLQQIISAVGEKIHRKIAPTVVQECFHTRTEYLASMQRHIQATPTTAKPDSVCAQASQGFQNLVEELVKICTKRTTHNFITNSTIAQAVIEMDLPPNFPLKQIPDLRNAIANILSEGGCVVCSLRPAMGASPAPAPKEVPKPSQSFEKYVEHIQQLSHQLADLPDKERDCVLQRYEISLERLTTHHNFPSRTSFPARSVSMYASHVLRGLDIQQKSKVHDLLIRALIGYLNQKGKEVVSINGQQWTRDSCRQFRLPQNVNQQAPRPPVSIIEGAHSVPNGRPHFQSPVPASFLSNSIPGETLDCWASSISSTFREQRIFQPTPSQIAGAVLVASVRDDIPKSALVRLCAAVQMRYGMDSTTQWDIELQECRRKNSTNGRLGYGVAASGKQQSAPTDTSKNAAMPTSELISPSTSLSPQEIDATAKIVQTVWWDIYDSTSTNRRVLGQRIGHQVRSKRDGVLRLGYISAAALVCLCRLCAETKKEIIGHFPDFRADSVVPLSLWARVSNVAMMPESLPIAPSLSFATSIGRPEGAPVPSHRQITEARLSWHEYQTILHKKKDASRDTIEADTAVPEELCEMDDDGWFLQEESFDPKYWETQCGVIAPDRATKASPGSEQKLNMLQARYALGLPFWFMGDNEVHASNADFLLMLQAQNTAENFSMDHPDDVGETKEKIASDLPK
ncbi:hypothetical protein A3G69_02375 [Candidatus Peribacteria bacterium RIFCSPLOWO2_12_FULL_53_10]|nr:MAG: hypothetical protein A3G69_02375 [Candidatus Peribacteria bacterium RIFCSPLOWO2_12_FULL_53_10]